MFCLFFFFFNDTATTEIYTLSLHDALPIFADRHAGAGAQHEPCEDGQNGHSAHQSTEQGSIVAVAGQGRIDRKSTRLNSSHLVISYAVYCLKKKKKKQ